MLIANTGGDRLIDWVGEFNSYLVPFAPFGMATVSRTLQPQLAEFLYALSASDGADPTRAADTGSEASRNGEPEGELGVIRQKDFAWHDQTGAPTDPQAGNIPGGKRDVLRTANFNDGNLQGLAADSGTWSVTSGSMQVAATSAHADAVAVYQIGDALPGYFEVQASAKVIKPTGGWNANSFIIFDYISATDFKFAGLDVSTNKLVMGHRDATGWVYDRQQSVKGGLKNDTWYNLALSVNGLTATLVVDNGIAISHTYAPTVVDGWSYGLNWGLVGFGSNNARGVLDNIAVQVVPPATTVARSDTFDDPANSLFSGGVVDDGNFALVNGQYVGTPAGSGAVLSLANVDGIANLAATSILDLGATLNTTGRAGFVFDQYSATDYKWVAIDVQTRQVLIGHRQGNAWTIDAAVGKNTLAAGANVTLGVSLRGSTVSVTLDGQTVLGLAYNAVTIDGRFGVFAKGGTVSIDAMTIKTDDAAVSVNGGSHALMAAEPDAGRGGDTSALTMGQLQPVLDEALLRWSLRADAGFMQALGQIDVQIVDLPGLALGEYLGGVVYLDIDAAGHGWFVDPTPRDDREFAFVDGQLAAQHGEAVQRMDLLSALAHELGHAGGLEHADSGVMATVLHAGVRTVGATPGTDRGTIANTDVQPGASNAGEPVAVFDPAAFTSGLTGGAPAADAATVPVINWAAHSAEQAWGKSTTDARPAWHGDFFIHLGQTAAERNPTAGLRIHVPVASKITPTLAKR